MNNISTYECTQWLDGMTKGMGRGDSFILRQYITTKGKQLNRRKEADGIARVVGN